MSGSEVRRWSSTTTPPRWPTIRPQARASSSRGLMPAETTIISTSSSPPSAKAMPSTLPLPRISLVFLLRWTCTPRALILPTSTARAGVVDLPRHQARGELDDVRLQAEVVGRLGRLQAEQAAADDRRLLRRLAVGDDLFQVFDGAIDEDALLVDAGHRRHERRRTGRQHDGVVGDLPAAGGAHHALLAVDLRSPVADEEANAVLFVPVGGQPSPAFRPCGVRNTW